MDLSKAIEKLEVFKEAVEKEDKYFYLKGIKKVIIEYEDCIDVILTDKKLEEKGKE